MIAVVGVIMVGITGWYSLLLALGSPTPIDALLATDLALLLGTGAAVLMARRSMQLATPPGSPGALERAIGLGSWRGLQKPLVFAVLTLVLATPAILGVMNLWPLLLEQLGREPAPQDVLLDVLSQRGIGLVLAVTLASFVGPALEELLFRGFLQPALRTRLGIPGAILMTSFLFASIHGLDAAGPVFGLSLVLGFLRERTDRLEPAILAHCLWNGTTLYWSLALAG
jgi:membrane protease YdiL (CAAX protease family)